MTGIDRAELPTLTPYRPALGDVLDALAVHADPAADVRQLLLAQHTLACVRTEGGYVDAYQAFRAYEDAIATGTFWVAAATATIADWVDCPRAHQRNRQP